MAGSSCPTNGSPADPLGSEHALLAGSTALQMGKIVDWNQ